MTASTDQGRVDRLTISLAPGQREALQEVADLNNVSLADVVRYAIARLVEDPNRRQLAFRFPEQPS